MKPKLKPFSAWVVCVGDEAAWSISRDRRECVGYIERGVHMGISVEIVRRVVVRSSEDDAAREADIRRLRRELKRKGGAK